MKPTHSSHMKPTSSPRTAGLIASNLSRRSLLGAGALLSVAGLAACQSQNSSQTQSTSTNSSGQANSGTKSATTSESQPKDPIHVDFVLDYTPNTNHTGLYVALDQGYFEEEGLDVSILQPPADGADALIGAGSAQLGVSYQDYIANNLASSQPLPYTAIAAIVQHNTSGIMSRLEDGITSAKYMSDHIYATWNLPIEQATIKDVVELDGGSYESIIMVPYETDDEVSGLMTHMFDTVWVYEGWAVQNAKIEQFPYNYFAFKDIDPRLDFYTPVLAVNDDFAAAHPDAVSGFLRAAKKGYEFCVSNPDQAAQILINAVPELSPDLVKASQAYLKDQYIADASSWGVIDPTRWSTYFQWINENNLTEKTIDVNAGFTSKFLA